MFVESFKQTLDRPGFAKWANDGMVYTELYFLLSELTNKYSEFVGHFNSSVCNEVQWMLIYSSIHM